MLCRFHVGTGIPWCCAALHSSTNTFEANIVFLLVRLNLGFILRENLLLHSSYLALAVSQRTCALHVSCTFSGAVAGEIKTLRIQQASISPSTQALFLAALPGRSSLLLGESLTSNLFTLLFVLLSLFLFSLVCSLYQKHKKISYLFLFCYFGLVLFLLK